MRNEESAEVRSSQRGVPDQLKSNPNAALKRSWERTLAAEWLPNTLDLP